MKIYINKANRWTYFQWFILGFYDLEKEKKISLKIKLNFWDKMMFYYERTFIGRVIKRLFRKSNNDSYHLDGILVKDTGEKVSFTIDCSDTPYMFDLNRLKKCDVYFKMQYPKCINDDAFHLTNEIDIPWIDSEDIDSRYLKGKGIKRKTINNLSDYTYKIFPLMCGTRQLAKGNKYKELKKGYLNYLKSFKTKKEKKGMCYFGNSFGPKPSQDVDTPDFGWEADIEGFFGNKVNHPNEKRAYISRYINSLGEEYDGRIICDSFSDSKAKTNTDLIIPLEDFCEHISHFEYNFNVSGYAMSIPNRFIESFMVGTSIVTDELAVKWFKDFDEEVFETVKMGYYRNEDVDWERFEIDVRNLKPIDPMIIKKRFEDKWAPIKVAEYIINTIINESEDL